MSYNEKQQFLILIQKLCHILYLAQKIVFSQSIKNSIYIQS